LVSTDGRTIVIGKMVVTGKMVVIGEMVISLIKDKMEDLLIIFKIKIWIF